MAYIKAKEKKELLELLDLIAKGHWKEVEVPYTGSGIVIYNDYVELDKDWQKKAKKLKRLLK